MPLGPDILDALSDKEQEALTEIERIVDYHLEDRRYIVKDKFVAIDPFTLIKYGLTTDGWVRVKQQFVEDYKAAGWANAVANVESGEIKIDLYFPS